MKVVPWGPLLNGYSDLYGTLREPLEREQLQAAYRFVGIAELKYDALPADWRRRVEKNLLRGFSTSRDSFYMKLTRLCAGMVGMRIGSVCVHYMDLFVPLGYRTREDIQKEIQALCGVTGKVGGLEFKVPDSSAYLQIRGRSRRDGNSGPRFAELKSYVDGLMEPDEPRRMKAVESLRSSRHFRTGFKSY